MFSGRGAAGQQLSSRLEDADATTSLAPAHVRPSTTRPSEVCDCDCVLVIPVPATRSGTTYHAITDGRFIIRPAVGCGENTAIFSPVSMLRV